MVKLNTYCFFYYLCQVITTFGTPSALEYKALVIEMDVKPEFTKLLPYNKTKLCNIEQDQKLTKNGIKATSNTLYIIGFFLNGRDLQTVQKRQMTDNRKVYLIKRGDTKEPKDSNPQIKNNTNWSIESDTNLLFEGSNLLSQILLGVFSIIIGLCFLLRGIKMIKLILFFSSFLIGAISSNLLFLFIYQTKSKNYKPTNIYFQKDPTVGVSDTLIFSEYPEIDLLLYFTTCLLVGLFLGCLSIQYMNYGVLLLGMLMGYFIGSNLTIITFGDEETKTAILITSISLFSAMIAFLFSNLVSICFTSCMGTILIMYGLDAIFEFGYNEQVSGILFDSIDKAKLNITIIILCATVALFSIGAVFQTYFLIRINRVK